MQPVRWCDGRKHSWRAAVALLFAFTLVLAAVPGAGSAAVDAAGAPESWVLQNPLPTPNAIYDVDFIDGTHGWAAGINGTVLATSDGGVTWTTLDTGVTEDLSQVTFVDASHGWAWARWADMLMRTTDGGLTWSVCTGFSSVDVWVLDLTFVNATHGWAVGGEGKVYATVDGGLTWTPQVSGTTATLWEVAFVDQLHGWIGGDEWPTGRIMLATDDGGASWTPRAVPSGIYTPNELEFFDENTGWVHDGENLYMTTNGGDTWTQQTTPDTFLGEIAVLDASHAWIVVDAWMDPDGGVLATVDGGENWVHRGTRTLSTLAFTDATHGCGFNDSMIYTTADGGETWTQRSVGVTDYLFDVAATDASHAWAAGPDGLIVMTTDGGGTWTTQVSGTTSDLGAVDFTDNFQGWVAGSGGEILVTSDGGATWTSQVTDMPGLADIQFVNNTTGWAVGDGGAIVATTNGGVSWTPQSSGVSGEEMSLSAVDFLDSSRGWAAGSEGYVEADRGVVVATTNGGVTWTVKASLPDLEVGDIAFVDSTHGWLVGSYTTVYTSSAGGVSGSGPSSRTGVIMSTSDGGSTWTIVYENDAQEFASICFADATHAWAVGSDDDDYWSTAIVATTDGGQHWFQQSTRDFGGLYAVSFANASQGWAVGDGGLILATTDGGGVAPMYTVTSSAGTNGTISPLGAQTVTAGYDLGFTITPNTGYHIADVLVDGESVGAVSSYTFESVNGNHTISATFAVNPPMMPVYRFYNTRLGVHFYTANEDEKNNVIATLGGTYNFEGPGYSLNPMANSTPLHRFYNRRVGVHFYTADEQEKANVIANLGNIYTYEGVAYNVSGNSAAGPAAYRFFRPSTGTHFYTADTAERDHVRATLGSVYSYEGPAFYLGQ